jgi:predicted RNase H-like nuclease (RuvC/YqgF family)
LRVSQCLLQDENSDLHEQLEEEQARSDELEAALDDALMELDEQMAAGEMAQKEIRIQSREVANLRVRGLQSPSVTTLH